MKWEGKAILSCSVSVCRCSSAEMLINMEKSSVSLTYDILLLLFVDVTSLLNNAGGWVPGWTWIFPC
jgi:hypothetical protein